ELGGAISSPLGGGRAGRPTAAPRLRYHPGAVVWRAASVSCRRGYGSGPFVELRAELVASPMGPWTTNGGARLHEPPLTLPSPRVAGRGECLAGLVLGVAGDRRQGVDVGGDGGVV